MDHVYVHSEDETWIAKYRAAVKDLPVQPSGLIKIREALSGARNVVFSHLNTFLDRWAQCNPPKSAPSVAPTPVLQLHSSIGKANRTEPKSKPPAKRATASRLRPTQPTYKRGAQRQA
jgi:hypothetical protein